MDTDDLEPIRPKPEPMNLEEMSIEALTDYIVELEAEIGRVRATIEAKKAALTDADSFFKAD
ncbi:MAG: DUF1192 domain-containing protein [Rhodospirillales bacterium]|nr:DUF1192 domain-containing protein [Rhodospirillales bacterium]